MEREERTRRREEEEDGRRKRKRETMWTKEREVGETSKERVEEGKAREFIVGVYTIWTLRNHEYSWHTTREITIDKSNYIYVHVW